MVHPEFEQPEEGREEIQRHLPPAGVPRPERVLEWRAVFSRKPIHRQKSVSFPVADVSLEKKSRKERRGLRKLRK